MELTYYGAGCVLIATKQLKILLDPPAPASGLKLPNLKPDVTLHTTQQAGEFKSNDHFEIDIPGEYEIKGVGIQGVAAQLHTDPPKDPWKAVMYVVEAAGLRLLATGNIAPDLTNEQIEAVGEANVLIVPIGGHGLTLDANAAAKLVSQFEPSYVVPVHYHDGQIKYPTPQDGLDKFLKEVGGEGTKPVPKLKVSAKELGEETTIVVLERSS